MCQKTPCNRCRCVSPEIAKAVTESIREAAAMGTIDLGDFSQYLEADDESEEGVPDDKGVC